MKNVFMAFMSLVLLASCGSKTPEDKVKDIDKTGALESSITIAHLGDTADVVTTSHVVWKDNAQVKTILKKDTIPSLGKQLVKDDKDNTVSINKDYEIYITIKE
jgi:uncharacterized protein YcfL